MNRPAFHYEQLERFGESHHRTPVEHVGLESCGTTQWPRGHGGFHRSCGGWLVTGHGIVGQLAGLVHWYLQLG